MPIKKDELQDDYYAHLDQKNTSSDTEKKPLKIKKPILKKSGDISVKEENAEENKPKV